jgi:hypothetical protein
MSVELTGNGDSEYVFKIVIAYLRININAKHPISS